MRKSHIVGGVSTIVLALALAVSPAAAQQQGQQGQATTGTGYYGMMGPGTMGGQGMMGQGWNGMGPGMMRGWSGQGGWRGMGPGMMGSGVMTGLGFMGCPGMARWSAASQGKLNLAASDVQKYLDGWVAMTGNKHLKAGPVAAKDANTITADIVTTGKGDLVQRFAIDRHTGVWTVIE